MSTISDNLAVTGTTDINTDITTDITTNISTDITTDITNDITTGKSNLYIPSKWNKKVLNNNLQINI